MTAPAPRITTEADLDWRADHSEEDGKVAVTIAMVYSFSIDDLLDGSEAFLTAFWNEYAQGADDEVGRLMGRDVDTGVLASALGEVLEPLRVKVEQALAARFRAMVDELGAVHEKLTCRSLEGAR